MELQEDAYRVQQVLDNTALLDIITFLRKKVSLVDTEIRCELALQHFMNLEDAFYKKKETFENDIKADFLCIKHLLKWATDEDIKALLHILGSIPNRKYVAVKLLLHERSQASRKKRKNDTLQKDICEASVSKLVKLTDTDKTTQTDHNGIENSEVTDAISDLRKPLKLIIKSTKDRNGNDKFVVTPPKTIYEVALPQTYQTPVHQHISSTTPEVIDISNQEDKTDQETLSTFYNILNRGMLESTVREPSHDVPSTSRSFQSPPGPSQSYPEVYQTADDMPSNSGNESAIEEKEVQLINDVVNSNQNSETGTDLSKGPPRIIDEKLVLKIIEMFPEASPDYIRDISEGKQWSDQNFDEIVTVILSKDYPKRPERYPSPPKEVDPEEQLKMLMNILTDADPSYLQEKLDHFAGDQEGLESFMLEAVESKQYPTLKEYLRKQQVSAQQRQYTAEFNVERFVELFPDPAATFENPEKTTTMDPSDKCYVRWFMRNKYNQLYAKDVNSIVENVENKNIISIVKALEACVAKGSIKKSKGVALYARPDTHNIPLLQELAYFEHRKQIYEHIENKKRQATLERQNAKELGLFQTCSCCYDEEVMPNDILTCTGGCRFCRDCIKRGTEVAFGDGKVVFPCLMQCGAEFSLPVLQNVLPPKVFSKLAQKKAVAEVKAAGIEDLETCPFCDFATIPAPDDKLFRCLNQDCMKESCRLCKEPSHVPFRCNEVEKDEGVKARTYIEDKMTEALIRQCWKCNAKFIKEEGCNKMTCSCGAIMCYVCRKPVKDYKHFNGQGGDKHDLCPLYTDNFLVNEKNVLEAAEEAKKQIDPSQLKSDPTADIQKHFGKKIKEAEHRARQHQARPVVQVRVDQFRQVQMLRQELREQLLRIQDLNRPENRQIINQMIQLDRPRRHRHIQGHPPTPQPNRQGAVIADWHIEAQNGAMLHLNREALPQAHLPHRHLQNNPAFGHPRYAVVAPADNAPEQQEAYVQGIEDAPHVNGYAMGQ